MLNGTFLLRNFQCNVINKGSQIIKIKLEVDTIPPENFDLR